MKSGPDSDRKESDKNHVGPDRNIQIRQDPVPLVDLGIRSIEDVYSKFDSNEEDDSSSGELTLKSRKRRC